MTTGKTFEDFIGFLDYTLEKGLMKSATVQARKAAANKVFEALDDADRSDVLAVDLDHAMERFVNKSGNNYSPGSLQTYNSRLKSALIDFQSYKDNPMGFRPAVSTRTRKAKPVPESTQSTRPTEEGSSIEKEALATGGNTISAEIMPIPIRANLIVRIQGLPHDLTTNEAKKIAAVIQAFAIDE